MDTIQAILKSLDPKLTGQPVPSRSYAEDCSLTVPAFKVRRAVSKSAVPCVCAQHATLVSVRRKPLIVSSSPICSDGGARPS